MKESWKIKELEMVKVNQKETKILDLNNLPVELEFLKLFQWLMKDWLDTIIIMMIMYYCKNNPI